MEEFWLHSLMVDGRIVFGAVVGLVVCSWLPVDAELVLVYAVTDPMEMHIDRFRVFVFHLVVCKCEAVELSTFIGVAGWGCQSSPSVVWMGHALCQLMNAAPTLASMAELMAEFMVFART